MWLIKIFGAKRKQSLVNHLPVKETKMQKKMLRQMAGGIILLLVFTGVVFAAAPPEDILVTNSWMIDDPIVGALRDISSQTGVRIVPDETVVGYFTTDVSLENVPLKEALRRILTPGGYTFRWLDTFYLVGAPVPDNPNFARLTETEVIKLNYVQADSILGLLARPFQDFIRADSINNRLIVTASPEMIERIRADVAKLDKKINQVEVQLLIGTVSQTKVEELGFGTLEVEWGTQSTAPQVYTVEIGPFDFGIGTEDGLKSAVNMKILYEKGFYKLTGSPKVRVLAGRSANISLGQVNYIIIPSYIQDNIVYGSRTEQVEAKTDLQVKVVGVTDKNEIVLEIKTVLGDIAESLEQTRLGTIITANERNAETALVLKNYETIPIGSIVIEKSKKVGRVPPYKQTKTELIRMELYMTANIAGTPKPEEYRGLEEIAKSIRIEEPPAPEFKPNLEIQGKYLATVQLDRYLKEQGYKELNGIIAGEMRLNVTPEFTLFGGGGKRSGNGVSAGVWYGGLMARAENEFLYAGIGPGFASYELKMGEDEFTLQSFMARAEVGVKLGSFVILGGYNYVDDESWDDNGPKVSMSELVVSAGFRF